MSKFLNKFYDFVDKIGKVNFMLLVFILFVVVVSGLLATFSLYTSSEGLSIIDGIKTFQFILNADNSENSVTIASGSSKNVAITVSNHESIALKYGVFYTSDDALSDVGIGYLSTSDCPGSDVISQNTDCIVTLKVYNHSASAVTIQFGILYGLEKGGDLLYDTDQVPLEQLPSYKQEVSYIESNGTQYIDTNFYPNQDSSIEFVAESTSTSEILFWFGGRNNSGVETAQSFTFLQLSDGRLRSDYHNTQSYTSTSSFTFAANTKYTILKDKNVTYIDGATLATATYESFYSPSTLNLFGVRVNTENIPYNAAGGLDYRLAKLKLYSCKIWDNGTLIRDYIPVIDWEGVACLYDKVEEKLYYNENTSGDDFSSSETTL